VKVLVVAGACALVVCAACGGGGAAASSAAAGKSTTTTTVAAGAGPSATTPVGTATTIAGSGTTIPGGASSGGGGAAGVTTTTSPVTVTATLASACVRPGKSQTITIHTNPESGVVYHATYSDGKDATKPGYYGGNKGGRTDASGNWTDTWVIAPTAPAGRVRVDIAAATRVGTATNVVYFAMSDAAGHCS